MKKESLILKEVREARLSMDVADAMIIKYMSFIEKQVYEYVNTVVFDTMDELSIAMIAFHEVIRKSDLYGLFKQ